MTYESKEIILEMLKNNGTYPGDPQMACIYSYIGFGPERVYAVFAEFSHNDLDVSPYVRQPILLWDKLNGLSKAGQEFIDAN